MNVRAGRMIEDMAAGTHAAPSGSVCSCYAPDWVVSLTMLDVPVIVGLTLVWRQWRRLRPRPPPLVAMPLAAATVLPAYEVRAMLRAEHAWNASAFHDAYAYLVSAGLGLIIAVYAVAVIFASAPRDMPIARVARRLRRGRRR